MAKLTDVENLSEAFDGCRGVFHTAAFVDPAGLSGYSLWYALGKLRAEKAAWRTAEQRGLKMVTICPGLITGPEFFHRNSTATTAYLKGAQEMYACGLLATVNVNILAAAHVCAFEAMNKTAFGRYICYDRVIRREDEADMGMQTSMISGNASGGLELSNMKLSRRCRSES